MQFVARGNGCAEIKFSRAGSIWGAIIGSKSDALRATGPGRAGSSTRVIFQGLKFRRFGSTKSSESSTSFCLFCQELPKPFLLISNEGRMQLPLARIPPAPLFPPPFPLSQFFRLRRRLKGKCATAPWNDGEGLGLQRDSSLFCRQLLLLGLSLSLLQPRETPLPKNRLLELIREERYG
mmetsp:Transcript_26342/g.60826  ORF Transcript_26342/g.60826 Transcript_26342/m.60826 type:complete len:179 (-) Transcript_26342:89-625(-)